TKVPFIVSWPGNVKEGTTSNDMINLLDIFATVADITDGSLPKEKDVAPDSFSFLPSLTNTKNEHPRNAMVTADANGMHAIRVGEWKYIDDTPPVGLSENKLNRVKKSFTPQLFNLADDPSEKVNLLSEKPDVVKELSEELNRIRKVDSTR
ncbi:MAG: hypothetical protein GQ525_10595, partial [Draconibacterium sp.]|nr:hypothetical protein [Draconibacterium sp.]